MRNNLAYCDTSKLRKSLALKANKMSIKSVEILIEEATRVMADSKAEVPVDTGTLLSIADVVIEHISPVNAAVHIGYGVNGDVYNTKTKQYASRYAVLVHEDLTLNHPNGGKAKFFEDPLRRGRQRLNRRLRAAMKQVMK